MLREASSRPADSEDPRDLLGQRVDEVFNHSSEAQRLPASPSEATPSTRHRDRRQRVINFRAGPSAHSAIEAPPARRTTTTRTASPQGPGASPPRDGRTMRSACANGERSNAASSNSIARLVLYACIRKRPVDHPFTRYLQIPPDDTKGSSARASNWTHSSLGNQHRKQRFSTPQLRRLRPRARSRTPSGAPSRRRAAFTRARRLPRRQPRATRLYPIPARRPRPQRRSARRGAPRRRASQPSSPGTGLCKCNRASCSTRRRPFRQLLVIGGRGRGLDDGGRRQRGATDPLAPGAVPGSDAPPRSPHRGCLRRCSLTWFICARRVLLVLNMSTVYLRAPRPAGADDEHQR